MTKETSLELKKKAKRDKSIREGHERRILGHLVGWRESFEKDMGMPLTDPALAAAVKRHQVKVAEGWLKDQLTSYSYRDTLVLLKAIEDGKKKGTSNSGTD